MGAGVPCRTFLDPIRGQAGFRWVPAGHIMIEAVYESYTSTNQSSDPSRPVGSSQATSDSVGFPWILDLAQQDPLGLNGPLNYPVSVYD